MDIPAKPVLESGAVRSLDVGMDAGGPAWDRADKREGSLFVDTAQLGLWSFLGTVVMLFAGFTSAYLVRQTTGSDWQTIPLPPILWLSTFALVVSSITLELGRARQRIHRGTLKHWLSVTCILGAAFLAAQIFAWRHLAAQGIFLPSNPHSSFFYILTGAHGLHLAGGIVALASVLLLARRGIYGPELDHRVKLCATYWHFVGALWLYLFLILFVF